MIGAVHGSALGAGAAGERGEIDMRGEVRFARRGERVGEGMAAHRLQGVAGRCLGVAVVDDQRGAAEGDDAAGDFGGQGVARRRHLEDCAFGRLRAAIEAPRPDAEGEPARLVEADRALAPHAVETNELPDRQGVEELVGDEKERAVGHVAERSMPVRRVAGPRRVAACFSRRTGLVSTRCTVSAAEKSGTRAATRRMSAISVPRPGPSSTRRTGEGAPARRQASISQAPTISPNIWLTSGAVVKSPAAPKGSRVM